MINKKTKLIKSNNPKNYVFERGVIFEKLVDKKVTQDIMRNIDIYKRLANR
jgi:hypothetical protein